MGLSGAQLPANLHDTGSSMFFHIGFLALRAGLQVGIHIFQSLGGHKGNIPAQFRSQLREADMETVIGIADGPDNGPDDELQILQIPIFPGDDLLPVPLVHIDGVDIVQLLVPADGVHIGVQAVADAEIVPLQGKALPFGQGMNHLGIHTNRGDIEGYSPLVAVQVIVQTGVLGNEQRSGHTLQVQGRGKLFLEGSFDVSNGPLGIVFIQNGPIAFGNVDLIQKIRSSPIENISFIVPEITGKSRVK